MGNWQLAPDIEEQIDRALAEAASAPPEPIALDALYNRDFDMVILRLDTGRRLLIPREELQGLEDATEAQLSEIEIHAGVGIAWPQLDVDHYLPYLLEGRYATEKWRAAHAAAKASSTASAA